MEFSEGSLRRLSVRLGDLGFALFDRTVRALAAEAANADQLTRALLLAEGDPEMVDLRLYREVRGVIRQLQRQSHPVRSREAAA